MDNVGIIVDDLKAAIAFFTELGLEVVGEMTVEGEWVDRVLGLDGVRSDIVMMRTPDGHSRLELSKFQKPKAINTEPNTPVNTLGIRRLMFAVTDIATPLLACSSMAPNLLARWCSTRTCTGSATCVAPRALW